MPSPSVLKLSLAMAAMCLVVGPACRPKPRVPSWVQAAPGGSLAALSGEAGWMLNRKEVQSLISREPMVERALDLFLQKAHINPATETGRVTFHILDMPSQTPQSLQKGLEHALVQLNQFSDPAALLAAMAEAFPQEGTLHLQGKDWPLYVILDVEAQGTKAHIRAASDEKGQIWLGSLEGLQRMASEPSLAATPETALAAEWINAKAPFQGYLNAQSLLSGLRQNLDQSVIKDMPQGVHTLFWSITPGKEEGSAKEQPIQFDLALSGTPEGINQVTPWLQRLVAAANAIQGGPGAAPELMQEKRRVGLRASLTAEQLKLIMEKLGQPAFSLSRLPRGPKA
jgi:hypothetical protein